jgi:phosphinothricin acetyltransferase
MAVEIRPASPSDYAAVVAIYNQAIAANATAHLEALSVDDRREWLEAHDTRYPLLVAETDAAVVGWTSLSPYRRGRGALRHTAEISYYVDGGYRQRGIATALISYAVDLCETLDLKTLVAILLGDNHASIGLLKKIGFEEWAVLPAVADFDGREVDHVYYGLRVANLHR